MTRCMTLLGSVLLLITSGFVSSHDQTSRPLIIDMHLYALKLTGVSVGGGPAPRVCSSNENIVWNGWDTQRIFTIEGSGFTFTGGNFDAAALQRYNIRAVTSGESGDLQQVSEWRAAAPDRIIPAANFLQPGHDAQGRPLYRPVSDLRQLVAQNRITVFAEVGPQYDGMSPADPALEPYFAQWRNPLPIGRL